MVGFSIIWNIPACFVFKYEKDENGSLFVNGTTLTHNPTFKLVYVTWLHGLFKFFIPLTLLIIFNAFSIKQVSTVDFITQTDLVLFTHFHERYQQPGFKLIFGIKTHVYIYLL